MAKNRKKNPGNCFNIFVFFGMIVTEDKIIMVFAVLVYIGTLTYQTIRFIGVAR